MKKFEYEWPEGLAGFDELQKEVVKDKRKKFLPATFRPFIYSLSKGNFERIRDAGTPKDYTRRELNTVMNSDIGLDDYQKLIPSKKTDIKSQFESQVRLPVVAIRRKDNLRYILTDRYSLTYSFRILNNSTMKVIEIKI